MPQPHRRLPDSTAKPLTGCAVGVCRYRSQLGHRRSRLLARERLIRASERRHPAVALLFLAAHKSGGFMTDQNIEGASSRAKEAAGPLTADWHLKSEGRVDQPSARSRD